MSASIPESALSNIFEMLIQRLTDLEEKSEIVNQNVTCIKEHLGRELLGKDTVYGGIWGLNYTIEKKNKPYGDEYYTALVTVRLNMDHQMITPQALKASLNDVTLSGPIFEDFAREASTYLGNKLPEYVNGDDHVKDRDLGLDSEFAHVTDTIMNRVVNVRFANEGITYYHSPYVRRFDFVIERQTPMNTVNLCKLGERLLKYLTNRTQVCVERMTIYEIPGDGCDIVKLALLHNGQCNKVVCEQRLSSVIQAHNTEEGGMIVWLKEFARSYPSLYTFLNIRMFVKTVMRVNI
jgi:hypothetical protein